MLYVMFGALALSVIAGLWMAKLLGEAGAYKPAFMVGLIATLGWCMPVFIQVFLLAGFITIAVQYWVEVRPAFMAWAITAGAVVIISHTMGTEDLVKELNGADDTGTPAQTTPVGTTTP